MAQLLNPSSGQRLFNGLLCLRCFHLRLFERLRHHPTIVLLIFGRKKLYDTITSKLASTAKIVKGRSSTVPNIPVPARELRLQPPRSSTRLNLGFEVDSGTGSCSDSDSYSDPDTDLDALSDTDAEKDAGGGSDDEEPDTKAEEILGAITHYRNEGPGKPKHTLQTQKLWRRESEFWQKYCRKIQKRTGMSPEDQIRACDPAVFKSYLFWRKQRSRIKKESAIDAY
ncbi:hypothetical protein DM02DRAFT_678784 [Periconia macrospinosa]|uniref:Uncharacterized protein n=1 Tax=Periconia macrospinosa TaxID=97972 RepID=A0A2V1CWS8_9PLEO|nr:hypothetical protein DM02DRAFT_678784 [Periconia macrospinosa]